jgi:hypothetical protein
MQYICVQGERGQRGRSWWEGFLPRSGLVLRFLMHLTRSLKRSITVKVIHLSEQLNLLH